MFEHRPDASLFEIVEDFERRMIIDMLEQSNWNQTEAAERFHVPLSTLNQKIKRLNIEIRKKGVGINGILAVPSSLPQAQCQQHEDEGV